MTWKSPPSVQTVHSIGMGASEVARRYFDWMTESLPGVRVERGSESVEMFVRGSGAPAIVLQPTVEDETSASYRVVGGILVNRMPSGVFAFVKDRTTLTIALHDFAPRLPAALYLVTHHLVHAAVMSAFCRSLEPLYLEEVSA